METGRFLLEERVIIDERRINCLVFILEQSCTILPVSKSVGCHSLIIIIPSFAISAMRPWD